MPATPHTARGPNKHARSHTRSYACTHACMHKTKIQMRQAIHSRAPQAKPLRTRAWRPVAAIISTLGIAALLGCAQPARAPADTAASAHDASPLVQLRSVAPGIVQDMRYHGSHNFMGRPVARYEAPNCWLSRPAAAALAAVQADAQRHGLRLKVYDCYRPQGAVDDFVRWGKDLKDQSTKPTYYPRVPKEELFKRGYIAEKSGHSRASTVDIGVLVDQPATAARVLRGPLNAGAEVDFGTPFDLFDEQSHTETQLVSPDARHNRLWLRTLMDRHGWRNLPEEWWHFTLKDEPFKERYFEVPVRADE